MNVHVPTNDGHWVSEKHARIAEIIQDYDPTLELVWIPPETRTPFEKPFAIVHHPEGLKPYFVMYIKEDELDERVLARLFQGDLTRSKPLNGLEAMEHADKVMRAKELMDKAEERQDFIKTIVGSGKHSFKHNGKVIPT